jgi:hypothetical protein
MLSLPVNLSACNSQPRMTVSHYPSLCLFKDGFDMSIVSLLLLAVTFAATVLSTTIDIYPTTGVEAGNTYTITHSLKSQVY